MKYKFCFFVLLFAASLFWLDRHFLKGSDSFCIGNIYGKVPFTFEAPPVTLPPNWNEISSQSFHYLKRGHQSYVFLSDDGKIVLKFYRFPSEMRTHPWISHPFSFLSQKRQKIRKYNLNKLKESLRSFHLAYEELKKETGLVMIHLKPTETLRKKVRLHDRLNMSYLVDLDQAIFLIQKRAELIFPHLEKLLKNNEKEKIQKEVASLVHLIANRSKKGVADLDAAIEKNYGFLEDEAIHIDVGRFVRDEKIKTQVREEVEKVTAPLKSFLTTKDPALLSAYEAALQEI